MAFTKYITNEGDRWDLIAYKAYGDPLKFVQIMKANPKVPAGDYLAGNITIYVPVQEQPAQSSNLVPPWKR